MAAIPYPTTVSVEYNGWSMAILHALGLIVITLDTVDEVDSLATYPEGDLTLYQSGEYVYGTINEEGSVFWLKASDTPGEVESAEETLADSPIVVADAVALPYTNDPMSIEVIIPEEVAGYVAEGATWYYRAALDFECWVSQTRRLRTDGECPTMIISDRGCCGKGVRIYTAHSSRCHFSYNSVLVTPDTLELLQAAMHPPIITPVRQPTAIEELADF